MQIFVWAPPEQCTIPMNVGTKHSNSFFTTGAYVRGVKAPVYRINAQSLNLVGQFATPE